MYIVYANANANQLLSLYSQARKQDFNTLAYTDLKGKKIVLKESKITFPNACTACKPQQCLTKSYSSNKERTNMEI